MADTQIRDEPTTAPSATAAGFDDKHDRQSITDAVTAPATALAVDPESLANQPQGQYDQVTGVKLLFLLLSLALACFLILLDTSVISTAVPKITDDFQSLKDVGWYASSYQVGSVVLQLMTGKIYLHFSLKWSFIVFFFIFEVGSALSGAAQSSAMLIISRAISGIGASGLINGAITIVSASVPLERRPRKFFFVLAALAFLTFLSSLRSFLSSLRWISFLLISLLCSLLANSSPFYPQSHLLISSQTCNPTNLHFSLALTGAILGGKFV